ncbi:HAD hydrolase-like protein [Polaromonas sp. P1(28)-8]|nr:HAD hydrolase-like protein [Polaromonas sp. P1(28)-8]
MSFDLTPFEAMTFDVYGTLIDWEPTIMNMFGSVAEQYNVRLSRDELLMEFDAARASLQRVRPALLYPDVLRTAYKQFCEKYHIPADTQEQEVFANAVMLWPGFEDTRSAMSYLWKNFKIGLLSNIDNASLEYSHRKLGINADVVITAQKVAAYKPDLAHFRSSFQRIRHVGNSEKSDSSCRSESSGRRNSGQQA